MLKRKREAEYGFGPEDDQSSLSAFPSRGSGASPTTPTTAHHQRTESHSTPNDLGRPSILSRSSCSGARGRGSSPHKSRPHGVRTSLPEHIIPTVIHNKTYNIISSRFASPNTLSCASALSLLSRKDTSPQSLSGSNRDRDRDSNRDCRLSPSMADRLLPFSATSSSAAASAVSKTPMSPCGINYLPQTPDFKPFPHETMSMTAKAPPPPPLNTNTNPDNEDSPYRCKSAVHLFTLPDVLNSYPLDSSGIPQISLPIYLLSASGEGNDDDDHWTRPVIDVKGFISKAKCGTDQTVDRLSQT
jgi:hypothetical protein